MQKGKYGREPPNTLIGRSSSSFSRPRQLRWSAICAACAASEKVAYRLELLQSVASRGGNWDPGPREPVTLECPNMIGIGIAANVTEFILTTLIGRRITLALDDRKRAARAFIDLYESLCCLERSLPNLERELQTVVSGSANRLYGASMGKSLRKYRLEQIYSFNL
jgi:hypothetical protein